MNHEEIESAIEAFMHPTVYTGVQPLFLLAEELPTKEHTGDIVDVVWVHIDDATKGQFSYITKFAVQGKIRERKYHSPEEVAPFKGRLALPTNENLEKMVHHRLIQQEMDEIKTKRNALADEINKDFDEVFELLNKGEELHFFRRGYGNWVDPFYDIIIETPYSVVEDVKPCKEGELRLQDPKTGIVSTYNVKEEFYGYFVGSKAEIVGLQLKDESFKKHFDDLQEEAKSLLMSLEWLELDDERVRAIVETLPRHPFDEYFKYVKKGQERPLQPPASLLKALEIIIEKHMPDLKGPMGVVEYIPVDNLLYLFHEIIPRIEALHALEVCDIIHEPSALLLGFEGQHQLPPKFLVSIPHVAYAYQHFPRFVEACERYLD